MTKAIIWGITGQDGSHLSDLLLEKGYDVVGVSRRSSVDNTGRIKHLMDSAQFTVMDGDITDAHSVVNVFRNNLDVDEVYNLAAQSHVGISFTQPGLTWDITGKGCLNILQSIVDLKLDTRFYQASSSEMFGSSYDEKKGFNLIQEFSNSGGVNYPELPAIEPIKYQNEDTKFLPQSPYAIAKCAAHYMTRLYREAYGVHASAGILFNHEGPRRGEQFVTRKITKWIGDFMEWRDTFHYPYIITKVDGAEDYLFQRNSYTADNATSQTFNKLRLGNLDAYRDWGFAGDYCEAMYLMLQQDKPDDYVICTGETHTIREFLDVSFNHVGIPDWESYVVIDPKFYRPAEVDYLRGDNSKALQKLGWVPKHSFNDLVKLMVEHDVK